MADVTFPLTGTGAATQDVAFGTGARGATVQRVTIATDDVVPISDGGNVITVDGTVTLGAGSAGIGKLTANSGVDIGDVDVTSVVPGTAATNLGKAEDAAHTSGDVGVMALAVRKDSVAALATTDGDYIPLTTSATGRLYVEDGGGIAHDGADSGNPIKVGARATNAMIAAVSANDRTDFVADLQGRQLVSHIDPAMQVWKYGAYSSQQTGATIWDPTAGKRIAITYIAISCGGTTAGVLTLWFGANGDTTYSAGTDQLVFRATFTPTASGSPGAIVQPAVPIFCVTADNELHITTSAAINPVDVTVYGYEY